MLYIITPCSRPQNLDKIYQSINIPTHLYRWIVIIDGAKPLTPTRYPSNVEIYYYHNPDSVVGHAQRNVALDLIQNEKISENPFVYFLDDDSLLHPDLFESIRYLPNDFVHFNQQNPDGTVRIGGVVKVGYIDTGSAVVRLNLIGETRWLIQEYSADGIFWSYINAKAKTPLYLNKVLSTYNQIT